MPESTTLNLVQDLTVDGITMTITGFSDGDVMSLSYEDSQTNANPTWYHVTLPAATGADVTAGEIKYAIPDDKISTAKAVGKSVVTCSVKIGVDFWYKQENDVVVIGIPPIVSVGASSNSVVQKVTVNTMVLDAAMMSQFDNGIVVFTLKSSGIILSQKQETLVKDKSSYNSLGLTFETHNSAVIPELHAQVISADGKTGPAFSVSPVNLPTEVDAVNLVGFDSQTASGEFFYTFNNITHTNEAFRNFHMYWSTHQNGVQIESASFEVFNSTGVESVPLSTPLAPGTFQLKCYIKGYLTDDGVVESIETSKDYIFDSAPVGPIITLKDIVWDDGSQTYNLQCDVSNTHFSYVFSLSDSITPADFAAAGNKTTTSNSTLSLDVTKTYDNLTELQTELLGSIDSPIYLHATFIRNEINGYDRGSGISAIESEITTFGGIMPVKRAAQLDNHVVITGYTSSAGGKVTIECNDYNNKKIVAQSEMNGSIVETLSTSTSPSGEVLQFNAGVAGEAYTIRIFEETQLPNAINSAYKAKNGNVNALEGHKRESTSSFTAQPTIESVVLRPVSPGLDILPYDNSQVLKVARMQGNANGNLVEKLFVLAQSATGNQILNGTIEPAQDTNEMLLTDGQVLRKDEQDADEVVGAFEHDFTFDTALGTSMIFGVFDTPSQADAFKHQASGHTNLVPAVEYLNAVSAFNAADQEYNTAHSNFLDIDNQSIVSDAKTNFNTASGEEETLRNELSVINASDTQVVPPSLAYLNKVKETALTNKNAAAPAATRMRKSALDWMNKMAQNEARVEAAITAALPLKFSTASGETHAMISWFRNYRVAANGSPPDVYVWFQEETTIAYPAPGATAYTSDYLIAYLETQVAIASAAIDENDTALEPTVEEQAYTTAVGNYDLKAIRKTTATSLHDTAVTHLDNMQKALDIAEGLIRQGNDDAAKKLWGAIDLQNNRAAVTKNREDVSDIPASVQLSDGTSVEPKARTFLLKLNEYHPLSAN